MPKTFISPHWGTVFVQSSHYSSPTGPLAIQLFLEDGEPLATLSVNMYRPACSADSRDLPPDCFYAKQWSENEEIAAEALASGLFIERPDLGIATSGFVTAPVWQIKGVTQ